MSLRTAVLVLVASAAVTGCTASGAPVESAAPEPRPAAPIRTVDGEPMLTCGGDAFPASAMVAGIRARASRADVTKALDDLVRRAGLDAPFGLSRDGVQPAEWKVLAEDADSLTLATGPWGADGPGEEAHVLGLERHGPDWVATSWGDCDPRPVPSRPGAWAAVTASAPDLTPDATAVPVRLTEQACTSGRDPGRSLHEPVVVETQRTVTVYATSDVPVGAQKCPGNPSAERVIELDEPLGDRTTLDGSTWPATPVTAPS